MSRNEIPPLRMPVASPIRPTGILIAQNFLGWSFRNHPTR